MFEEEDAEKLRIQSQEKFELSKTLLAKLQNYFSLHPRVKGMSKVCPSSLVFFLCFFFFLRDEVHSFCLRF